VIEKESPIKRKIFSNVGEVDEFLGIYIKPSEVAKGDLPTYRKLKRDLLGLGPIGQRFTRKRIEDFLPADDHIEYNRPMMDKLIEIVSEAKGHDAPAAE
jgi:hypothetical protein